MTNNDLPLDCDWSTIRVDSEIYRIEKVRGEMGILKNTQNIVSNVPASCITRFHYYTYKAGQKE